MAQSLPRPSYITTDDGLSMRIVTSICLDNRNLVWIGTTQGIERYDGVNFLKINSQKTADIFFPGGEIAKSGIILINEYTLWVLADEKIYAIDLCSNNWSEINLPYTISGKVTYLTRSGENEAIINVKTDEKLFLIKYKDGIFTKIGVTERSKYNATCVLTDSKKNIWWSTPLEGIKIYDANFNFKKVLKPDSIDWYGLKLFVVPFFIDSKDRIFLFPKSVHELWLYNPLNDSVTVLQKDLESPIYNAIEDTQGNLWFACKKQLLRVKNYDESVVVTDETEHISKKLNYTIINQLYEDKNKILWIATNNGLIKLPVGPQKIDNFLVIPDQEWGNEMRGIFESNAGDIYAYCENYTLGLHKIIGGTQISKFEQNYHTDSRTYDVIRGGNSFCYHKKLDKAYFLINNLMGIDLKNNHVTTEWECDDITEKLDKNPLAFLSDSILILGHELSKTTLYDPVKKSVFTIFKELFEGDDIKNLCFADDVFGNIWIGTNNGLYITTRNGILLQHLHTESTPKISNNTILTIHRDKKNNMWLGTLGGGVNYIALNTLFNKGTQKNDINLYGGLNIVAIRKEDGLCSENVPGILEDDFGYLWFSTYDGLARYQPESRSFKSFVSSDGISNNEFNYTSAFKDSKGNLWFGGLNGLNKINPAISFKSSKTEALALLSLIKYNRRSNQQERIFIAENDPLKVYEISPYVSWFQFNWTLPNYINNQKNIYYVKLEGANNDDNWQYNGNLAFIRYNNLAPGNYVLKVKGVDSKGVVSPGEISVKIKVNPFFYQTRWFRLLALILTGSLIYYIYHYNLNKKLEMERMRTRIASDLHDEVGSMLSGLAMQSELLLIKNNTESQSKLENIANISRDVIMKMRDLVWSIDSRRDSVQDLIDRMMEKVDQLLTQKDIAYTFETGDLPLNKDLSVNVRQQIFLIFTEVLTNIVRHSDADKVTIRMGNQSDYFVLSVYDNGSKSCTHKKSTGMGLSNMKMRAEKIGQPLILIR
jgi:ligand-binding sensor domain-containing protein/two-component sensor histidine kinase